MVNYSVAIRTLGKVGEKYQKLLDSIARSNHQPEKVIVVLPEGYELPKERLGYEKFVFCPKSMIQQRIEALKYIDSDYTLFLDDDIEYDDEFVDKLLKPLENGLYDCSTGPLFSFFPISTIGKIVGTLTASVCMSIFHRDMYVKILRSGGWSYRTFDTTEERYYPTESFAWTCFMIRTEVMRKLRMEDEKIWLERFGYAAGDDRVMAYKLVKHGYKACIVSNALYIHNDAKTSTSAKEMINTTPIFCMHYMHVVFWHRFIQEPEKNKLFRLINRICFTYWNVMMVLYQGIKALKKEYIPYFKAFYNGIQEGKRYIETKDYIQLPNINCE